MLVVWWAEMISGKHFADGARRKDWEAGLEERKVF